MVLISILSKMTVKMIVTVLRLLADLSDTVVNHGDSLLTDSLIFLMINVVMIVYKLVVVLAVSQLLAKLENLTSLMLMMRVTLLEKMDNLADNGDIEDFVDGGYEQYDHTNDVSCDDRTDRDDNT